ncbi:MAG: hypothetical protein KBT01_04375 [Clostridiales bacterium]|nr:hypothetical protein [Candidatus Blautia equi]
MNAFHSLWTLPGVLRNQGRVDFPDFELLTAILSALKWKENNGSIKLITDTPGALFFKEIGMEGLWDDIDLSLDDMDVRINPFLFWAAGKLFALKKMETPCVMLDTDLIIWEKIDGLKDFEVVAAHPEALNPFVYPDPHTFLFEDGYTYPENWDFSIAAANTAFLYLKNQDFRDRYVEAAMDFFLHVKTDGLNTVNAMCFAEQRVLPMCAKAEKQKMAYLLDLARPEQQSLVTHTWGYKNVLRQNEAERTAFCKKCVRRVMKDFPESAHLITENPILKKYAE